LAATGAAAALSAFAVDRAGARLVAHVDSRNASAGITCAEGGGSLTRARLGDVFRLPREPAVQINRCTWLDLDFSRMGRYEVFDVLMRFDNYAQADSRFAAIAMIRPVGPDLQGGVCGFQGNKEVLFVRVFIHSGQGQMRDHWKIQLRGGASPWSRDQKGNRSTIDLGRVVEGAPVHLKLDLFFHYRHGAATVWKNGVRVYRDRDRALGFHYNCDYRSSNADTTPNSNARDLSRSFLRMQHGIYRDSTPAWTLTSTGFRFTCSQRTPC
jgi:hypothetical protein